MRYFFEPKYLNTTCEIVILEVKFSSVKKLNSSCGTMSTPRFIGYESEAQNTPMCFNTGFEINKPAYWKTSGISRCMFTRIRVFVNRGSHGTHWLLL